MRGKFCSVFWAEIFLPTVSPRFAIFQSPVCLRFFVGGFFGTNFGMGVRSFFGVDFCPKNAHFASRKRRRKKVLPVLGFFRSSIFVTARFCGGFWATSSVMCIGRVFVWFWVCVFVWIYLSESGSSCFFAVLGTLGPLFRGPVLLFSSPSFFFPLSSLGVGLGSLSFLLCVCRQDRPIDGGRSGLAQAAHATLLFLFSSLCPAGPSLPCPFLSLSSLSLSCMLQQEKHWRI